MSGYATYEYHGTRPSRTDLKAGGWANFLKPQLWQTRPSLSAPVSARSTDLVQLPVSEAAFRWNAVLMGYGLPAHYASLFLLEGRAMRPAEHVQLRQWILARSHAIEASHDISTVGGLTCVTRKSIYPLIETSEVAFASYLIGSAFAQTCAPVHIQEQLKAAGFATIAPILYHTTLLKKAAAIGIDVAYSQGSNVDFIAFDDGYGMHFIEAKGDDGIYAAWIKSIYQCMGVVRCTFDGANWFPPASLTSSLAFGAKNVVYCGTTAVQAGIRAVLTAIPGSSAARNKRALPARGAGASQLISLPGQADSPTQHKDIARRLAGFRFLATCLVIESLSKHPGGDWTIASIGRGMPDGTRLQAAIPTKLLVMAKEHLLRYRDLQVPLFARVADAGRLGETVLAWRGDSRIAPPLGFAWTASDPFLAFPNA